MLTGSKRWVRAWSLVSSISFVASQTSLAFALDPQPEGGAKAGLSTQAARQLLTQTLNVVRAKQTATTQALAAGNTKIPAQGGAPEEPIVENEPVQAQPPQEPGEEGGGGEAAGGSEEAAPAPAPGKKPGPGSKPAGKAAVAPSEEGGGESGPEAGAGGEAAGSGEGGAEGGGEAAPKQPSSGGGRRPSSGGGRRPSGSPAAEPGGEEPAMGGGGGASGNPDMESSGNTEVGGTAGSPMQVASDPSLSPTNLNAAGINPETGQPYASKTEAQLANFNRLAQAAGFYGGIGEVTRAAASTGMNVKDFLARKIAERRARKAATQGYPKNQQNGNTASGEQHCVVTRAGKNCTPKVNKSKQKQDRKAAAKAEQERRDKAAQGGHTGSTSGHAANTHAAGHKVTCSSSMSAKECNAPKAGKGNTSAHATSGTGTNDTWARMCANPSSEAVRAKCAGRQSGTSGSTGHAASGATTASGKPGWTLEQQAKMAALKNQHGTPSTQSARQAGTGNAQLPQPRPQPKPQSTFGSFFGGSKGKKRSGGDPLGEVLGKFDACVKDNPALFCAQGSTTLILDVLNGMKGGLPASLAALRDNALLPFANTGDVSALEGGLAAEDGQATRAGGPVQLRRGGGSIRVQPQALLAYKAAKGKRSYKPITAPKAH